jgi:hypothetical protein
LGNLSIAAQLAEPQEELISMKLVKELIEYNLLQVS